MSRFVRIAVMESFICPACKAENDEDAAYCDQCGQHLVEAPEADATDGDCPACGGVVESRGDGKGVCAGCGLELVETPDEPEIKTDGETVKRLTDRIVRRVASGTPLQQAIAESCQEVLRPMESAGAETPILSDAEDALACPLCGAENRVGDGQCSGCGLWLRESRSPQPCPRCERPVRGGKCECGAILTLAKLLQYVESSVRFVCSRCKQPYAVSQPKCPDCGGGFVSAERLKAYAKDAGSR